MDRVSLALPKGRIMEECLGFLEKTGLTPLEDPRSSRKMVIPTKRQGISLIILRGWDIPTYVEHGAADVGIVGLDVLEEQGQDVYQPLDLKVGHCRMVVAESEEMAGFDDPGEWTSIRVATKYTAVANRHFQSKGVHAEIIRLSGSVELAPLAGLSSRVVDLVATGRTLKDNNLVEVEEIMISTARLIVNRASMKLKHREITALIREVDRWVA